MVLANKVIYQNGAIREFEKPEVCEAIKVANENRLTVGLTPTEWDERETRLKKKHEENTKDPDSAENHIKEDSSENPALAESASQFNGALLDEQGKKIKRLGKEIARLNKIIHKKNLKIEELRKESSRHLEGKMKMFGENFDLEQELKDKDAVLADVAEELRLSKIREKNLTEVSQKYVKEVEDLREQLANKVVDKIDAQALKSAESALAWKENVIDKLAKENNDYKKCVEEFRNKIADMTIGKIDIQNIRLKEKNKEIKELNDKLKSINKNRHNELAEKDGVIADLGKELTESKKRVEWVRNASKEYCDYGVAANEFIKELAHLYVLASNNGNIDVEMLERCKNYQTYGFPANCNRETKKEINDIVRGKENKKPRIPTPEEPKHDNGFKDFINKTIGNYNRRAAELGCAGSKDGNGIFDQMVGADISEEGGDNSGVTVLCGKDCIDDIIKKMK